MQLTRSLGVAIAVVLGLGALSTAAHAYPQFQFTTGNDRCSLCHVSPAGGGLLTYWGRSESADTISMGDSESFLGDPRPLNGLWEPPSWFDFGGDYRGA
ncbi:MAG TPA: hypothetical protein VML75_13465, partial [Kofleriaceae bacterium]|nr:hypothetical protein [Kofleriaceae bacterium]